MKRVTFKRFLGYVANNDVFGYNQMLVERSLRGPDNLFRDALVLDAGAGQRIKTFKSQLSTARFVVGIDMAFDDLKQNHDVGARVLGNAEKMPFQSGTFDSIVSVDVVEHLTDPQAFLREAGRCMRPGGTMVILTPNLLGYKNLITNAMPKGALDFSWRTLKKRPGQPFRTYYRANTVHSMKRICKSVGLEVEQAHHVDEISHFFYGHPALCVLAYAYGRLLRALGLESLLNYLVFVLRKPQVADVPVRDTAATTSGIEHLNSNYEGMTQHVRVAH